MILVSVLANDPAIRPSLVQKLGSKPGWAADFLKAYPRLTKVPSRLSDIVGLAKSAGYRIDRALLSSYMTRLIRGGQYDSAYYVWLQTLTEEQLSTLPPVYNGGFEQKLTGAPFDWLINAQAGVEAGIEHADGKRMGKVLWLRFMGDRVQPKQVSQFVRLTPGTYLLSGDYRFREFVSSRGLA